MMTKTRRPNPNAQALGRLGGQAQSEKKMLAARKNALKRWRGTDRNRSESMIRATGTTGWASDSSTKGKKDGVFETDRKIAVIIENNCEQVSFEAYAYDGHWSGTLIRSADGRLHGRATSKDLNLDADVEMTLANDQIDPSKWVFHGAWLESEEGGGQRKYEWWGELKSEQ